MTCGQQVYDHASGRHRSPSLRSSSRPELHNAKAADMALGVAINRHGCCSKNRISRQHEKCFDMTPNVSEAQVLTPCAHGEAAVRVSALREPISSAKSPLGIPNGDPRQDLLLSRTTLTLLVLHGL